MKEKRSLNVQKFYARPASIASRIRRYWDDFSDKTGLEGFGYLKDSSGNIEYALWTIVIIVAIALTIWDMRKSINDYLEEETTTKVTTLYNAEIDLHPTFCIGLQPTNMALRDVWSNVTRVEEVLSHFLNQSSNLLQYLQEISEANNGVLNDEPGRLLKQFVGLSSLMIMNIVYLENRVSPPTTEPLASDRHFGVLRYNDFMYIDEGSAESLKVVHQFYNVRNISLPDALKVIGSLICRSMQTTSSCYRKSEVGVSQLTRMVPCDPERVTWHGYEPFNAQGCFLCLNVSHEKLFHFKEPADSCAVTIRPHLWYGRDDFENFLNTVLYLDFSGGRVMTRTTVNNVVSAFTQLLQFSMSVLGFYESIPTKHQRCSSDISFLDCRGMCRANWTMTNCGCYPSSWNGLEKEYLPKPDYMPYCSQLDTFDVHQWLNTSVPHLSDEACSKMQVMLDPSPECVCKCMEKCTVEIYGNSLRELNKELVVKLKLNSTQESGFVLSFDNQVFPYFTKSLKVELGDLFANLGGNIGFWTGACIVSCVYVFIWLLKLAINICSYAREKQKLQELKKMQVDPTNVALRPTTVLDCMESYYKGKTTSELLNKMLKYNGRNKQLSPLSFNAAASHSLCKVDESSANQESLANVDVDDKPVETDHDQQQTDGHQRNNRSINFDRHLDMLIEINKRVKRLEKGYVNTERGYIDRWKSKAKFWQKAAAVEDFANL